MSLNERPLVTRRPELQPLPGNTVGRAKPLYTPPRVESETIFERRALACAKCRTGPHRQAACMRLASVS